MTQKIRLYLNFRSIHLSNIQNKKAAPMLIEDESKLPRFLNYVEEDTDNGYETIQDFYLSWLVRCSNELYKDAHPKRIYEYSNEAVKCLIFGQNKPDGNFEFNSGNCPQLKVKSVKTWRQWNRIDLLFEIEAEVERTQRTYVLNIENKWYTKTSLDQLQKSKEAVINDYIGKNVELINLLIFCDISVLAEHKSQLNIAKECDYKCLTIGDIAEYSGINEGGKTGNALFDEYWFRRFKDNEAR